MTGAPTDLSSTWPRRHDRVEFVALARPTRTTVPVRPDACTTWATAEPHPQRRSAEIQQALADWRSAAAGSPAPLCEGDAIGAAARSRGADQRLCVAGQWSVVVPVVVVLGVAVAVVDVVHVVAVGHRDMAAAGTVLVGVAGVDGVAAGLTLVYVALVGAVQMPIVHIVDVVTVRNGDMAAAGTVLVGVVGVGSVRRGGRHGDSLSPLGLLPSASCRCAPRLRSCHLVIGIHTRVTTVVWNPPHVRIVPLHGALITECSILRCSMWYTPS